MSLGDFAEFEQADGWPILRGVLEDADWKLTRQAIRTGWPADYPCPSDMTLWRWLDGAVADGRVKKGGTGRRSHPFVYWLPAKEKEWAADPFRPPDPADLPPLLDVDELLRRTGHERPKKGGVR